MNKGRLTREAADYFTVDDLSFGQSTTTSAHFKIKNFMALFIFHEISVSDFLAPSRFGNQFNTVIRPFCNFYLLLCGYGNICSIFNLCPFFRVQNRHSSFFSNLIADFVGVDPDSQLCWQVFLNKTINHWISENTQWRLASAFSKMKKMSREMR